MTPSGPVIALRMRNARVNEHPILHKSLWRSPAHGATVCAGAHSGRVRILGDGRIVAKVLRCNVRQGSSAQAGENHRHIEAQIRTDLWGRAGMGTILVETTSIWRRIFLVHPVT